MNVPTRAGQSPASAATEWQIAELDVDAYLRRIGYDERPDVSAETLGALHRAHVASIPFENLDVVLGRKISVDLSDVQDKLVTRRRGGYCYEHGVLFGAVLQRIGFSVDRLLARTGDPVEHPRPRSHLVLRVGVGDDLWLADVGFGSGLLGPLLLVEGEPLRQGPWTYRLVLGDDGAWRLHEEAGGERKTLMTFTEEPQYLVDVAVASYNTSTNPASPFVQQSIVLRKDDSCIRSLSGRNLSVDVPGQPTQSTVLDDGEVAAVLSTEFGLRLSADEMRSLLLTLSAGSRG